MAKPLWGNPQQFYGKYSIDDSDAGFKRFGVISKVTRETSDDIDYRFHYVWAITVEDNGYMEYVQNSSFIETYNHVENLTAYEVGAFARLLFPKLFEGKMIK